jgi:hypothetical protein
MMGMNAATDGVYSHQDLLYSASFATKSERETANINVIKERLHRFGIVGYVKFLAKKTLVNYGDGTFAWAEEGSFYVKMYDQPGWISPMLKSFYYSTGNNYKKTSTMEQAVWIGTLLAMLGLMVRRIDHNIAVLMLSILGLTAFELIFEARARYLYIYAPIYICLGMLGLRNFSLLLKK